MALLTRRSLVLLGLFLIVCATTWEIFYTDKRSASGPVEVPIRWINEETLLSSEGNSLFLRKRSDQRRKVYSLTAQDSEFSAGGACISADNWWMGTRKIRKIGSATQVSNTGPISIEITTGAEGEISFGKTNPHEIFARPVPMTCILDTESQAATEFLRNSEDYQRNHRISLEGKTYFLRHLSPAYHERGLWAEALNSAPHGGKLYLHDQPRGLLRLSGNQVSVHEFSEDYITAFGSSKMLSWGYALWDRSQNKALFIQSACVPRSENEPCTRKALWLTPELEPLDVIELPSESLIEIKDGYSCFSCGCGCYSHQNIYVEGGHIFAHVWGYPVKNDKRGIYKLEQTLKGPIWKKVVSGRPQPPLAFSPSGEKVAYFELSRLGDRFVVAEIVSKD